MDIDNDRLRDLDEEVFDGDPADFDSDNDGRFDCFAPVTTQPPQPEPPDDNGDGDEPDPPTLPPTPTTVPPTPEE